MANLALKIAPEEDLGTERKTSRRIIGPIAISLAFHAVTLSSVPLFYKGDQIKPPPRAKITRVKFNRPKTPLKKDLDGQVVDLFDESTVTKEAPEDARFLSDKNRRVQRETQARNTSPTPSPLQSMQSEQQASPPAESKSTKPSKYAEEQSTPQKKKLDLSVPKSFLETDSKKVSRPRQRKRQQVASLPPTNYLPEIELGDGSLLNTAEYRYASFYIRMKRQMEAVWNPRRILGNNPLHRDHYITSVSITLDEDGNLEHVKILSSSGIRSLDLEAARAVQSAAPYLNPPKDLIQSDGKIRIRRWSFIVSRSHVL